MYLKDLYRRVPNTYTAVQTLVYYIVISLKTLSCSFLPEKCLANDEDIPWHIQDKAISKLGWCLYIGIEIIL